MNKIMNNFISSQDKNPKKTKIIISILNKTVTKSPQFIIVLSEMKIAVISQNQNFHMSKDLKIQLRTKAIRNVPLSSYNDYDFLFIINGEEFKTTKIISDLISPKISQIHRNDPTACAFTINTENKGSFSNILNLTNFSQISIPEDEIPFLIEIYQILGCDSIDLSNLNGQITEDNAIKFLIQHERLNPLYSQQMTEEIDFIANHFFKLYETQKDQLINLSFESLDQIISNPKLRLSDEDQLLHFIYCLYQKNPEKYSDLYCHVMFSNVETKAISEFIEIYNINDIDSETWRSISKRLREDIRKVSQISTSTRYKNNSSNMQSQWGGFGINSNVFRMNTNNNNNNFTQSAFGISNNTNSMHSTFNNSNPMQNTFNISNNNNPMQNAFNSSNVRAPRPKSAYIFFTMDKRHEVVERNPEFKAKDVLKELGRMWHEASEEEKAKYGRLAEEDKERVRQEELRLSQQQNNSNKQVEEDEEEDEYDE